MNYSFRSMLKRRKHRLWILWKVIRRAVLLFAFGIILNTNWGRMYHTAVRSLYRHLVCNVPVSCKANGDRNQLWAWLDCDPKSNILSPCHAEYVYVLRCSSFFNLSPCSIQVYCMYFESKWKIVRILIRWLRQKPVNLDVHCVLSLKRMDWL